jgi:hypothetical protein
MACYEDSFTFFIHEPKDHEKTCALPHLAAYSAFNSFISILYVVFMFELNYSVAE